VAAVAAVPAVVLRLAGARIGDELALLVFGTAVVAAAFLLAWAAEASEVDISGSLSIALLALIAVLPEFAVDLYFAFSAGSKKGYAAYAAANMTGSNRLLIGFGWSLVALVFIVAARVRARRDPRRGTSQRGARATCVRLWPENRIELGFLGLASLYAVVIPLTRELAWYDAVVLIGLFALYMWRTGRAEHEAPDLVGVSARLAALPATRRRAAVIALFCFAALVVLAAAKPFAEGLIGTGRTLGVDEFLLVQWLAPLASEAPELLVATVFALRGNGAKGVGTLLAAEVNQWTLLVGALPVAYLAGGGHGGLPLDARQNAEFILTSAQAVLGFAVLLNLRLHRWEAIAMLALFAAQFALPSPPARTALALAYLALAAAILVAQRHWLPGIARVMLRPGRESREPEPLRLAEEAAAPR
jgi:cation:H+ antiporter